MAGDKQEFVADAQRRVGRLKSQLPVFISGSYMAEGGRFELPIPLRV